MIRRTPLVRNMPALLGLILWTLFVTGSVCEATESFTNKVWKEEGQYHWQINGTERGHSTNLAFAINRCIWDSSGVRSIHVMAGGELSETLYVPGDVSLYGHGNTFRLTHGGSAAFAKRVKNISFHDMTIKGGGYMVFRVTACDNVLFSGIHIDGGFIGMRVDSRLSKPWSATSYNLTVTNCLFENLGSHGLETYGIDGCRVDRIVARNNGQCGVLFNNTRHATVGTIDAYRCCYGGGYAGLRFANDCSDCTVRYLRAVECGRGFFTVSGARNIVVGEVYIRGCSWHSILIQHSDGVGINGGTYDGLAMIHYTSVNSWNHATDATRATNAPPVVSESLKDSSGPGRATPAVPAREGTGP